MTRILAGVPIIRKTLSRLLRGRHDRSFIDIYKRDWEYADNADNIELVFKESHELAQRVLDYAKIIGVAPQLPMWMDEIPVLWVPSQTFAAQAVRDGRHQFIVLTFGFLSLLTFIADYEILGKIQRRRQELDRLSDAEKSTQEEDLWELFLKIFSGQLRHPEEALPLPSLLTEAPIKMRVTSKILELCPLFFALLHEIGHFKLGHLSRKWWKRLWWDKTIRTEFPSVVQEEPNLAKNEEYEADLFALQQGGETNRHDLLFGANRFFTFLSLVYTCSGYRSHTHPHPYNRLNVLLTECRNGPGWISESRDMNENLVQIQRYAREHPREFDGGRLFRDAREVVLKDVPDQVLAVKLYMDLTDSLLSDVAARPINYEDLYFSHLK